MPIVRWNFVAPSKFVGEVMVTHLSMALCPHQTLALICFTFLISSSDLTVMILIGCPVEPLVLLVRRQFLLKLVETNSFALFLMSAFLSSGSFFKSSTERMSFGLIPTSLNFL